MKTKIPQSPLCLWVGEDTRLAPLWLILRLYLAWIWLEAGWEKLVDPKWVGSGAGQALAGFVSGAIQKASGEHPQVLSWYAWFLEHVVLPHAAIFSYLVTFGEILVGVSLLLGILTALGLIGGLFMNFIFMFAGSSGINPLMLLMQLVVLVAWRTAGWIGLDRWVLPLIVKNNERT
ncbi:MAG: TQO small subunit DoxD [Candidatus Doudnabacteria bacterium]